MLLPQTPTLQILAIARFLRHVTTKFLGDTFIIISPINMIQEIFTVQKNLGKKRPRKKTPGKKRPRKKAPISKRAQLLLFMLTQTVTTSISTSF